MIVTRLKLANVRAVEAAEFRFHTGMNLIAGINGVGKTSVLDSLGVCLSGVVKHVNKLRNPVQSFAVDDIRVRAETLTVECEVKLRESTHTYLVHKPRAQSVPQKKKAGMPREQVLPTPERTGFEGTPPQVATGKEPGGRPLAILYSTRRAVPSERAPARGTAAGGISAAYAEAFANRELRLSEFAAWVRVQQKLRRENPFSKKILNAFDQAVTRFLPAYSNLRATNEKKPKLLIDHGESTLEVRQLSEGERGTLAMVLDLTRRLAQANPHVSDPAKNVEAVVLIDEIELHLHPAWQRRIVMDLASTFPKCQFIATTHSPQVIGEIEHDRIQMMGKGPVYFLTHSFGVDSSRVLEEIMEVAPRAKAVDELLRKLSTAIGDRKYKVARKLLVDLATQVGEDDPEVTRAQTLLEFMEDKD